MSEAPERIWLNMRPDHLKRYGKPFVTQGLLASPPYTEYVRANTQWQPIDTAPRDGTDILVWDGEVRTLTTWGNVSHVPIYGFLRIVGYDVEDTDLMDPQPLLWMPLPPPPTEE